MNGLVIQGRIKSIEEPQSVNLRTGGTAKLQMPIISDETKSIKLSLWDNQSNSIKERDNVTIEKGYTK
jgi:replication factor A1